MDREHSRNVLFVFMASVLFSFGGLLIKLIPWSALAINGARNLLGACVIGCFMLITRHRLRVNGQVLLGALSTMGVTTLFTVANKLTTAANTIVLQYAAPVFVILMMAAFYRVRPRRSDIAVCFAVLGGVVLFFLDGLQTGGHLGNLAALLSGVCYAGVFMMNASDRGDALSSCFIGQLTAGLIFSPFCLRETDFTAPTMLPLLALGILQVGCAYVLLSLGIRSTPPVTACLVTGMEPVMNPLWVALFYGEHITPLALVGAVIVVGSVLVYNVRAARSGPEAEKTAAG